MHMSDLYKYLKNKYKKLVDMLVISNPYKCPYSVKTNIFLKKNY